MFPRDITCRRATADGALPGAGRYRGPAARTRRLQEGRTGGQRVTAHPGDRDTYPKERNGMFTTRTTPRRLAACLAAAATVAAVGVGAALSADSLKTGQT